MPRAVLGLALILMLAAAPSARANTGGMGGEAGAIGIAILLALVFLGMLLEALVETKLGHSPQVSTRKGLLILAGVLAILALALYLAGR